MALVDEIKSGFVAGLALLAPLLVTIVAFQLIFGWLRGIIDPVVDGARLQRFTGNIPYLAEVIALVLLVLAVALLGYVAQQRLGGLFFGVIDRGLARVPVFSVVYTGVRQVADALTSQQSRYESVAIVEYPREGLYALGFITSESPVAVEEETGVDTYNVYLPGSPNPTQGKFALVPEDEIRELDMSVSQGIRLLVTTGIADDRQGMEELQANVPHDGTMDLERALEAADGTQESDRDGSN